MPSKDLILNDCGYCGYRNDKIGITTFDMYGVIIDNIINHIHYA